MALGNEHDTVPAKDDVVNREPTAPGQKRWLQVLVTLVACAGTLGTFKDELLPAFSLEDARIVPLVIATALLIAAVAAFIWLRKWRGFWTAAFMLVTGNALAAMIGAFAQPEPGLWKLGIYWIGPIVYGLCAYFWEWRADRADA